MAKPGDNDPTADLLIREVDEDVRRDQYAALWKRYGKQAIAVFVLVVVAAGGWEGWQEWRARQQREDAEHFAAAEQLAIQGKTKDAEAALAKLSATASAGYAYAAGMAEADLLMSSGDLKGAQAAYDSIAAQQKDTTLRDLAVLKSALASLQAGGDAALIQGRVASVAVAGDPWYYQATEILGMIALNAGDSKHARDLFKQLSDDAQAPQVIRARAAEVLAASSESGPPAQPPASGSDAKAALPPPAGGAR
jgi:hypothetical protein